MPITSSSNEAIELFKEARILSENFEFTEDVLKYDKAIKLDPDFALAYLFRAINSGNYNDRVKNIEMAVDKIDKVSDGEKHLILAYKCSYDADEGMMWDHLNKLAELHPRDKRINLYLGTFNFRWEKYDEALNFYKKALEIDKKFPAAINMMGYTYKSLEKFEESEKYFKKYIDLLPNNAGPYDSYADFLLSQERYDESIKYYKKALAKDESYFYSLSRIANIYILKKNYAEARNYYRKYYEASSDIGPKFVALRRIANTYLYEENHESAVNIYDEYKVLAKKNDSPYDEIMGNAYQGYILSCCGKPENALKNIEKSIMLIETADLNEDQRFELTMNAAIWKSHAYIEMGEFEKSEVELDHCEKLAEKLDNSYTQNMIILLSAYKDIKQKNYDIAINKLDKLKYKGSLSTYYNALAHDLKGDKEQATKYYESFINGKESGINVAMYYKRIHDKLSDK